MTRRIDLLGRYARRGYSTRCTFTGCSAPPSSTDSTVTVMGPLIITSSALIWSLLGTVVVVRSITPSPTRYRPLRARQRGVRESRRGTACLPRGPWATRRCSGSRRTRPCQNSISGSSSAWLIHNAGGDVVELMHGDEVRGRLLHDD